MLQSIYHNLNFTSGGDLAGLYLNSQSQPTTYWSVAVVTNNYGSSGSDSLVSMARVVFIIVLVDTRARVY
jgi:hypothetical protein